MTTTLHFDPLGTTSCLFTSSTVQNVVKDEDRASTTITGLATTLSLSMMKPQIVYVDTTNRYIDSLSDQQIVEMLQLLEEKDKTELVFSKIQEENTKVYKKI